MTRAASRGAVVLILLFVASIAQSEGSVGEDSLYVSQVSTASTGDLAPGAEIATGGRPLSIGEAVALAIRNNLDVEVERYGPMIADTDREGAWGAYDPLLSADMRYDVAKSSNAIQFFGSLKDRQREKGGGVGIDQLIPYLGASLGVRFESLSTSTRRSSSALDEQYNSSLFVTAKIPLARGLIWNNEWTRVKTSEIQSASSHAGFSASVMTTVQQTVDLYWNLVASRDQVRVAQKSLETSRALLEQTKTQYEVGVVSRVEVVEAEAGVADREFDLIRTANEYRNAQDALVDAVLGRELGAASELAFSPTEDPEAFSLREVDVAEAVDRAFRKRPELEQARRSIDEDEIDLKFAKNQRLPQFDVQGHYGFRGLAGEQNAGLRDFSGNLVPPSANIPFEGSYADSIGDWRGRDNYQVKGVFSIPLPNRTASKNVAKRELELRRSNSRLVRAQQNIVLEVRRAARTLSASAQGIQASERRRLAAEEQLRAERIRLEHGESTPFEVLQRESDLVEAESQKINALQSYRSAEVALERAQGTILEAHRVELDQAAEPSR